MSNLSAAQVSHYWERGYVNRIPVLDADELASFRAEFDRLEAAQGPDWLDRDFRPWKHDSHPFEDWFIELATHPRILDAVESLLGPDLLVRNGDVFTREVGGFEGVLWHVDSSKEGPVMDGMLSAWIGLSDSTRANGAIEFAVGTHRDGVERGFNDELGIDDEAVRGVEAGQTVFNEMEAGEMSLHHIRLIHRSQTNETDERRIGYVVRYMTPYVTVEAAEAGQGMLVRGRCPTRHFGLTPNFPISWGVSKRKKRMGWM